ncbi:carbon-nitrogen hydrolase family protein [Roseovarius sp. SCSIO 43702]|uniref:carbon-nitrogen hydrolase family protein n=1 Tax=Roseovarius sp. SCSIO 43702 TaxID=2823043 RepID=UPI001C73C656|nr:carbon-nitrogen hydrolase family protein [Roseovarius sp. SCSIO 43702]QYX56627.1 carbon-nitrogen hydrolase family protein [Roseovarius sp. SCSIO 43702]
MELALYQMTAEPEPRSRPQRIIDAMARARSFGADLMVAPELALSGYGEGDRLRDLAQSASGAWVQEMREAAEGIGISLVAGFPERRRDGLSISAMAVFADGREPVIYRKGFLYRPYEKDIFTPAGPNTVTFELNGLRVGMLICFDVEFPECVRALALAGADLVVVPTALPAQQGSDFIAQSLIRVRAHENQVFVAYCDHADADDRFAYQGMSSIVAPDASVLASAPETGEALITATIDPAAYAESREINPYIEEWRAATRVDSDAAPA